MAAYERALQELYRAPLEKFLGERARLAAELRAAGDKTGAAAIASRRRPTTSVWAVNQLHWQAREALDGLFAAAEKLRKGERATRPYHDTLAKLRKRAAGLLESAGHGASDATLRRVSATLAAIAAAGSFAPDPPGALAVDRDPPGFEAAAVPSGGARREPPRQIATLPSAERDRPKTRAQARASGDDARSRANAERQAEREAEREAKRAAAEERRVAQQEGKRAARARSEAKRLRSALRAATTELRTRERALSVAGERLRAAEKAAEAARARVNDLERRIGEVGSGEA